MQQRAVYRALNHGLGQERTVESDVYDYYMEGRDVNHGPIDHKLLRNFEKKRHSMFDDLIKTTEKIPCVTKDVNSLLKATHVFNFDEPICYDVDKMRSAPDAMAEKLLKEFYDLPLQEDMLGLPFHNTCIVTPDSATMLHAIKGHEHAYMFVTNCILHGISDMRWFCVGVVVRPPQITKVDELKVAVNYFYVMKANGKYVPYKSNHPRSEGAMLAPILGRVMAFVMTLNTPDRFILEVSPTEPGVRSTKYIPRSHQRSEYILLHPHVIRHYMKTESDIEGHKKRGHERRGHLRRYPDDAIRFPKAHGRVIQIPPLWIGRTEAVVGNRKYKVIL